MARSCFRGREAVSVGALPFSPGGLTQNTKLCHERWRVAGSALWLLALRCGCGLCAVRAASALWLRALRWREAVYAGALPHF